ncbi:hypothetical protein HPB51_027895 [Rhipicephalus microplus]|uniref:Uncharacterized protein n=1 Tax=Rhipicephalus microplus TaxID=6941 RepID=A0A9J6CYK9_RHIMP|nr:hypothetical protein HPB51_027895 [Rhipicephalus microplus]
MPTTSSCAKSASIPLKKRADPFEALVPVRSCGDGLDLVRDQVRRHRIEQECYGTGYGPLGDPLLSFTGRDPFFGAPYGDASRLNEDHCPSQASNGLYQLFETHALTGPSPAQSPLAGLSPSAARLTAQIAAPSPSYRGHSGVGGNLLTDPSWSRVQRVDDVVYKPARLTDNVAAFTDARWPETRVGDAFDGRGPPCSAVDAFTSRVRPQAPVGAQTLPSSMPCTGPFRSDAHVGEQARAPVTAAPASEQSPLHATAAQLLNVLLEARHSRPCALKGDPESPQPSVPSSLRVPLPEYSGYSDHRVPLGGAPLSAGYAAE